MRARIIFLGVSIVLLPQMSFTKEIDRERLNPILGSIVKVEAIAASGNLSLGSAVSLAPGKFVTNCHVTLHAERISVIAGGQRWPVAGQLSDTLYDLCLLDIPGLKNLPAVSIRRASDLRQGQTVIALGYTFGAGLMAQAGTIKALHTLHDSRVIQTTTPFNSGASGGGLFDEDGELIGILTFRLPGASAYYFSMPTDWLPTDIDNSEAYTKITPLSGPPPFWAHTNDALPYFMRAAALEANGDWQGLIRLTETWAAAEESNAEPWFMRGQAYSHIDRNEAAIKAYKNALNRDPTFAPTWYNIGEAYFRRGDRSEVINIYNVLKKLDTELAEDLAVKCGLEQ